MKHSYYVSSNLVSSEVIVVHAFSHLHEELKVEQSLYIELFSVENLPK